MPPVWPLVDRMTISNNFDPSREAGIFDIGVFDLARFGNCNTQIKIYNRSKTLLEDISMEVDVTKNVSWGYASNGGCATAAFSVKRSEENAGNITQGNLVEIYRFGERVYAGILSSLDTYIGIEGIEWITATCAPLQRFCDDVLVNMSIKSMAWNDAISALVAAFAPATVVSWTVPVISYTITDMEFREQPFTQVMSALVMLAQNGSSKPYVWGIDENYTGYIMAPPTTNKSFPMTSSTTTGVCTGYQVKGGEYTSIKNMLKVYGGNRVTDGRELIIQVNEATSRALYGDKQEILSATDIKDETDLVKWATAQAAMLGYPRDTGSIEIFPGDDAFRPWLHRIQITGFTGSPSTREHEIVSCTFTEEKGGNCARFVGQVENLNPFFWNQFKAPERYSTIQVARKNYDQYNPYARVNNYILDGLLGTKTSNTIFTIGTGAAIINYTRVSKTSNSTFTVGAELTNNAVNYIFLSSAGAWTVATSVASKPSEATNLWLYDVTVGNGTITGFVERGRRASPTPATIIVAKLARDGDYDNLASAIAALPAAGGIISVKEGTFSIASSVVLDKSCIYIKGCGANTILQASAAVDMLINSGNINDITFEALVFDINSNNKSPIAFAGIHTRIKALICKFINGGTDHAIDISNITDSLVDNCYFYLYGDSVCFSVGANARNAVSNCVMQGANIVSNVQGQIEIVGADSIVSGCRLYNGPVISFQGDRSQIIGNLVHTPGSNGITTVATSIADVYREVISNNIIIDADDYVGCAGIMISDSGSYHVNNTIIDSNNITGCDNSGYGVYIQGGDKNALTSNMLVGNSTAYFDGGTNTTISGNTS